MGVGARHHAGDAPAVEPAHDERRPAVLAEHRDDLGVPCDAAHAVRVDDEPITDLGAKDRGFLNHGTASVPFRQGAVIRWSCDSAGRSFRASHGREQRADNPPGDCRKLRMTAYTLLVFAGIWALMQGITDIVRAFQVRSSRIGP